MHTHFTSLELCAGAGGQALGLEQAGFAHVATVENDKWACETLRANRDNTTITPERRWNVKEMDVHDVQGSDYRGIDLLAGGVPCPPFSIAGKQLGADDDRDLFPKALEIIADAQPRGVMLENVRGLSQPRFKAYREQVVHILETLGYSVEWRLIHSSDYGVPQLRPRFILVALKPDDSKHFEWPTAVDHTPTVGEALGTLMASRGWSGAEGWAAQASTIAPTLVGGSKKHGGPDLGPTRAREAWMKLRVRGTSIAEEAPGADFPLDGTPRLTVQMGAAIQGFPPNWKFAGGKTAAWRQVGNAFPPPAAAKIGRAIARAFNRRNNVIEPSNEILSFGARLSINGLLTEVKS